MLAVFSVSGSPIVLGDDTNFDAGGRLAFRWEEWGAQIAMQKTQAYGAAVPVKLAQGNLDRTLGFRIGQSLGTLAAVSAFLKSVDSQVGSAGTLTLQPDAANMATMVYANCILLSAKLVTGAEDSAGMRVTISYKFEPTTLT